MTGQRWEDVPHDPADLAPAGVPHLAVGDRQWLHFTEATSGWPEHDAPGYFAACGAGAFGMLNVTQDLDAVRCPDCRGRKLVASPVLSSGGQS